MKKPDINAKMTARIREIKERMGPRLVILTHHYQRSEIVALGDIAGDSLALSQKAAEQKDAEFIVFCGVHFMAESAATLARPGQVVQIPEKGAGCPMADMVDEVSAQKAWDEIADATKGQTVIPIVYVNSDAEVKAFCGNHGGATCTSANADKALKWAYSAGDKVLFMPDQHLGRNTGRAMGMDDGEMVLYKPGEPLGGNSARDIQKARLILWDGFCHVHTHFTPEQVQKAKDENPGARVIVHPECPAPVVDLADASGSTSQIIKYVEAQPAGTTVVIGTEANLTNRLAARHGDKTILPLAQSVCPNMAKINLENLLVTLENLGKHHVVEVTEEAKIGAKKALDRMLDFS